MTLLPGRETLLMTADRTDDRVLLRRDRAEIGLLVVPAVGVVPLLLAWMVLAQLLAQVDPSQDSVGITRDGDPLGVGALVAVVGAVMVVLLFAGLPRPGRLRSAAGSTRGAIAQGVGGVVVALEAFLINQLHFYFNGPGDGCTYPGCWPLHEQSAALAAPGIVTGLSMLLMALLVRRVPWWIRALVPVVVLLATLAVQYAVWDSYLIPIFEGAPR
ncbi:hypothetical protein [Kribbella sp. NPDC051770]|uniref:hypothetical protein n=1 Tax=Kribbella sp. NPDC051770 TaxID=3155413 RepID=UPI003429F737